ncbi:MAG: nicotinamide riboside transporter PnuC [Bacteroidota bacterium]
MEITIINVLDWVSVLLGILSIPLNMYRKTVVWPVNILSNIINFLIYYQKNSYSRMITIACMVPINMYGWYVWKVKKEKGAQEKLITTTPWYAWGILLLLNTILSSLFYLFLKTTSSPTPIIGSITTIMTFIGLWLSANKKLESSIFWGIYNLLSIYQHQLLGMRLKWKYIIYVLLSPYTYYLWRKAYYKAKKKRECSQHKTIKV